jgi:hypothetical protein
MFRGKVGPFGRRPGFESQTPDCPFPPERPGINNLILSIALPGEIAPRETECLGPVGEKDDLDLIFALSGPLRHSVIILGFLLQPFFSISD